MKPRNVSIEQCFLNFCLLFLEIGYNDPFSPLLCCLSIRQVMLTQSLFSEGIQSFSALITRMANVAEQAEMLYEIFPVDFNSSLQ